MSVFGKIPEVVDTIKNFDEEKPSLTIESDNRLLIENYKTIRLFTDTDIEVNFDDFVLTVEGSGLVINSFTPMVIKISGKISRISYLDRR